MQEQGEAYRCEPGISDVGEPLRSVAVSKAVTDGVRFLTRLPCCGSIMDSAAGYEPVSWGFDSLPQYHGPFANWEGIGLTSRHDKVRFLEGLLRGGGSSPPSLWVSKDEHGSAPRFAADVGT